MAAVLGPVASGIGGLLGQILGGGDRATARKYNKRALEEIEGLSAPSIGDMTLDLESYANAGNLNPELASVVAAGPSAMEGVAVDPALKDAEMEALLELQTIGDGGLRLSDQNALNKVRNEVDRSAKASRDSIMANMNARGRGGSGFELAAQLAGAQGDADRLSNESLDIAAQAEDRALEALMGAGGMAGNMNSRDFQQQSDVARAKDEINLFNAANRQDVLSSNVNRTNDARSRNLENTQDLSNSNVDLRNAQQQHNKGLVQTDFENRANLAGMKNSAYGNAAKVAQGQGDATAAQWAGIGNAVGQGVLAATTNQKKPARQQVVSQPDPYATNPLKRRMY